MVFPLSLFYGKEEAFWTLASTLAIAIVKSSARIRLELFSDHSALVTKTREDHDVRDLAFRAMDPTKITRKNKFGSLAFKSSRLLPANTTRAVGRSKPIGRAHEEKVRNLSHTPLSARTHACNCTTT